MKEFENNFVRFNAEDLKQIETDKDLLRRLDMEVKIMLLFSKEFDDYTVAHWVNKSGKLIVLSEFPVDDIIEIAITEFRQNDHELQRIYKIFKNKQTKEIDKVSLLYEFHDNTETPLERPILVPRFMGWEGRFLKDFGKKASLVTVGEGKDLLLELQNSRSVFPPSTT